MVDQWVKWSEYVDRDAGPNKWVDHYGVVQQWVCLQSGGVAAVVREGTRFHIVRAHDLTATNGDQVRFETNENPEP